MVSPRVHKNTKSMLLVVFYFCVIVFSLCASPLSAQDEIKSDIDNSNNIAKNSPQISSNFTEISPSNLNSDKARILPINTTNHQTDSDNEALNTSLITAINESFNEHESIEPDSQFSNLPLTNKQRQWLFEHPVITICPDPKYAPIEMVEDGKFMGMTKDYMDLLGNKLGVKFEVNLEGDWATCYDKTVLHKNDLVLTTTKTPKREKEVLFTDAYIFEHKVIVTRRDELFSREMTIEDFYGKKVAVVKGYFLTEMLPKEHPLIEIYEVNSMADGLIAVAYGEADAMFTNNANVTHYINERNISNLGISGSTPYQVDLRIAVRSDFEELPEILNIGLDSISPEEHEAIKRKWINVDYVIPWYNQDLVHLVFALIFLLFIMTFIWLYTLRQQVRAKTSELRKINQELEKKVEERTLELQVSNQKLRELSERDKVTQIPNRHYLDTELNRIFSDDSTESQSVSIFMIDVDYFKNFNDTYGHIKGDEALFKVAQKLKNMAKRDTDIIARFGGEEFILVSQGMTKAKSVEFARMMLVEVLNLQIIHETSKVSDYLTICIGVTVVTSTNDISPEKLIQQADEALYQAKKSGRNNFQLYEEC